MVYDSKGVLKFILAVFFQNNIHKATFFDNFLKNYQNIAYMTVLNLLYRCLTTLFKEIDTLLNNIGF